jgi:putative regulator of septum formation
VTVNPAARRGVVPVAAVLLLLGGCGASGPGEPSTPTTAGPASAATSAGPDLRIGDCLDMGGLLSAAADPASLVTARCDEPHDAEIYAEQNAAGADLDGLEAQAQRFCAAKFEDFTGAPYDRSTLEVTYLRPTEESWAAGDRVVQCIAMTVDGPVHASFAGSADRPAGDRPAGD